MIVLDMKWFLIIMMGLITSSMQAQDSWTVHLNKKSVLEASEESIDKNSIRINASDLKKKNNFVLTYFENPKQKGWTRSLMVFDSSDKELKRIKGTKLSLTNSNVLSLLKKYKSIQLYTWSIPDDPALKARIRVRRVHLCTLVLD
jgi:hypothetical protein